MFWLLLFAAPPNANSLVAATANTPVISLTVESTGWSSELYWTAVFDKDLVAFAVERSSDGVDYQEIIVYNNHFVAAGDFDTFREQDNEPMPGDNFYRIRFTLADGEKVFSERRKVYFKEVPAFEIFPNPTGRQVNLLMKRFRGQSIDVLVFDGTGTQVHQQHIAKVDDGILRIELAVMNPGMYAVSVVHNGRTFTRRLVITQAENN
ncbi:MAG: T9SS type A sorting domain-containing protein [Saprospiraceae bacterium]|jgi:hypothetical protein|nr:T9SS type A sorting domain-containing protein [Saprospiraceae bacterium]